MNARPLKTLLGILLLSALTVAANAAPLSKLTIANLTAAFQEEAIASVRYERCAALAEKEGCKQAARLFRAASLAEAIHRDGLRAVLADAGVRMELPVMPEWQLGNTTENLKEAIINESLERDTLYPNSMEAARKENAYSAIRIFQFAIAAEKQHASLFQDALSRLGETCTENYYVCAVCGNTSRERPQEKCTLCREPVESFIVVE